MADMDSSKGKFCIVLPADAATEVAGHGEQVYLSRKKSGRSVICRCYYRKEGNYVES